MTKDDYQARGVAWAREQAIAYLRNISMDGARDDNERHGAAIVADALRAAVVEPCNGCPTEDECRSLGCGVRFGQIVPDEATVLAVSYLPCGCTPPGHHPNCCQGIDGSHHG